MGCGGVGVMLSRAENLGPDEQVLTGRHWIGRGLGLIDTYSFLLDNMFKCLLLFPECCQVSLLLGRPRVDQEIHPERKPWSACLEHLLRKCQNNGQNSAIMQ